VAIDFRCCSPQFSAKAIALKSFHSHMQSIERMQWGYGHGKRPAEEVI
jgi:hypothetical protein